MSQLFALLPYPAGETAMYVPGSFAQRDRPTIESFLAQHSFATLVTTSAGAPFATHLPLALDRDWGEQGALIGHLARANPQWRDSEGQEALAIFTGPHAYISPAWYEAEAVVPTWNYLAAHVYGRITWLHDADELLSIVGDAVLQYEGADGWRFDAGTEFARKLAAQIIGLRLEISRVEAKWKLSQNQPADRQQRVRAALESLGDENSRAVAEAMRRWQAHTDG